MSETTALATTDFEHQALAKQVHDLVTSKTPPVGIPIDQDDWDAMPVDERASALQAYLQEVRQSVAGITPEFPRIKFPTGGSPYWNLPNGPLPKFTGVILGHFPNRAFWNSQEITNSPPDCKSTDMRVPDSGVGPTGAKTCADCPKSKWESGKEGRGKACKEIVNVFIKREGLVPWHLTIPPTSIKIYNAYVISLVNDKEPKSLTSLETIFELDTKRGAAATYAILKPSEGRRLKWAEMRAAMKLRDQFIDQMKQRGIDEEVVKSEASVDVVEETPVRREPGEEAIPF